MNQLKTLNDALRSTLSKAVLKSKRTHLSVLSRSLEFFMRADPVLWDVQKNPTGSY